MLTLHVASLDRLCGEGVAGCAPTICRAVGGPASALGGPGPNRGSPSASRCPARLGAGLGSGGDAAERSIPQPRPHAVCAEVGSPL